MKKSLRIALISEHASPLALAGGVDSGGQNIYVNHVARKLAERGHHVDVFTRRDSASQPAVSELCPGARVLHVPAGPAQFVRKEELLPHMPAFAASCEMLLRHARPYDVAHANFFMSGMVARHLKQTLRLPFAITFHALGLVRLRHQRQADAFPPSRIDIEQLCVRDADAVIAECPQDVEDLHQLYGAAEDRLTMVPCGFDRSEFSPMDRAQARQALGLDPRDFLLLQLGRLVPRKGIDNVIRALAHARRLLPEGARLRLMVVGGDAPEPDESRTPEIARLRQVAEAMGVSGEVVFTGHRQRPELRHYYAAADVFVTTPWYEPFGITPLEAMACGVPVIASDVGGLRYTVVDGATGFLVPPNDPLALAQRIALLHADPALGARLGQSGRRRVDAMFTWDCVADGLLKVYRSIRHAPVAPPPRRHAPRPVSLAIGATVAEGSFR
ncbi:MAG: glycosyl transferase family 1 [Rhodoferax sp.]|nr:glycosyl transferase family 1 [Rhodoferax sp.]